MVAPVHARKSFPVVVLAIVVTSMLVSSTSAARQASGVPYSQEIEAIRLLHEKGDYPASLERSRSLISRVEQDSSASPLVLGSALDVLVESLLLADVSTREEMVVLARRALSTKERAVGPDDTRTVYSRMKLGQALAVSGELKEARTLLEPTVDVFLRALGPDDKWTAEALTILTRVLTLAGDLKGAREYGERAVRSAEAAAGPEDIMMARALTNLAAVHGRAGDLRTTIQMGERSVAIMRKAYQGDHPYLALTLGNLAWNMDLANEFVKSDELHKEAVAMYERTVGQESADLAWELNNYGLLFWRLGDFEAGRPLFESALAIWTKVGSSDASRAMNNLAITHRRLGDLAGARRYYERSLEIKEKTLGSDHQDVALVLYNTANLLKEMGDYAAAQRHYERALRIREARLGPKHTLTAYSLDGLGGLLATQGLNTRARPYVERAVRIWRELKAPEVAIGLSTLAEIAIGAGNLASALRYYDEAREIYTTTFGPDYVDVAVSLNNSAAVLRQQGDYAAARQRYAQALDMLERQFDANHPSIAETAAGLAEVNWQLGDATQALALALRSDRISREHFMLTSRTLSEREALSFSETRAPALDLLLTLAIAGDLPPDDRRRVMDAVIRSRALVLDEMSQRSRLAAGAARPEIAGLIDAVSRSRQRLANLIVRGARPGEAGYSVLVNDARSDREAAERRLASAGLVERDQLAREHAGLDEVVAALPADAAVVTFIAYDHLSRGSPATAKDRRYAALILRGIASDVTVVPIGAARAVEVKVTEWRKAVMAAARPGSLSESAYRRVAGALSSSVWNPVAPYLRDTQQLFLVPDGALNLVSFAALPDAQNRYLVESDALIHYLSAERDLVAPPLGDSAPRGLLTVGNPMYTLPGVVSSGGPREAQTALRGAVGCPEFQRVRFERLPAADREVQDVVGLWNAHVGAGVEQLSGAGATETAFKQAAPNNRILHLATHGFFLGSCDPTGSGTRGVGDLSVKSSSRPDLPQNALALSGLVLAGANQRALAGREQDDGILTAEEVAGLDLRAVEWAVLSACDTGVGEVRTGEGVFGLRRAFATAGVRTTIMSLWSVEDQSTREWMAALYRARLVNARSTAEAVREASRSVLESRRVRGASTHPFYWAAFVGAGDWR